MQINWNHVMVGDCDPGVAKKVKTAHAGLAERAEALQQERRDIEAKIEDLKRSPLTSMLVTELERMKEESIVTFQREVDLRRDLSAWIDQYHPALREVAQKADQATVSVAADIRSKLVAIGYRDIEDHIAEHGKITPSMILGHPEHLKARQRENAISGAVTSAHEIRLRNEADLRRTIAEMERIKTSVLTS